MCTIHNVELRGETRMYAYARVPCALRFLFHFYVRRLSTLDLSNLLTLLTIRLGRNMCFFVIVLYHFEEMFLNFCD